MKRILFIFVLAFAGISSVNAQVPADSLESRTSFRWEIMNGPLAGLTFEKDSIITYYFRRKVGYPLVFNAKVWKEGSDIPWLAIVKITDGRITDQNFRFDQAVNQRKQRFFLLNKTGMTIYIRLGNEQVMLLPGKRSRMLEAYQGWYVVETSYLKGTEVVPKDVIIGVAERQKLVEIRKIR